MIKNKFSLISVNFYEAYYIISKEDHKFFNFVEIWT